MSSSYELCPAFQHDSGYLIVRRVEKAFPVFLRCSAAHLPLAGPATSEALQAAELCADLDAFCAATARLVSQPALRHFEGGVPVLVYVARPGKEELFLEFADGLDQADDYKLLLTLPAGQSPLALVFGDPSLPIANGSVPDVAAPASDPMATAVHFRPAPPDPETVPEPPDETPTWTPADLPPTLLNDPREPEPPFAADLQPGAPTEAHAAPTGMYSQAEAEPPDNVVETSTTALNDLLRPNHLDPSAGQPPEPATTAPDTSPEESQSEPALEILLRQAPRLQAHDTELSPVHQAGLEALRGPAPEEVLAAVRQVVGALDDALQRQTAEHQTALQAVILATQRAVQEQGQALERRQAEQWERQQAALRQMHADQAAAIEGAIVRLDEERAAWQQNALRELQQASAQQLPSALGKLQDDLTARQQHSLNQLKEDLLSRQAAAVPAGTSPLASPAAMQELNWQLEKSAVSSQDLRLRVGQLLWVNLVLLLALISLAVGVFWLLRGSLAPAPLPTPTVVAATLTAVPPTPVPPTPVAPTPVPSTATAVATATTALPVFLAALTCANTERPRNFYDCALTNHAAVADTLALAVQADGEELHGFRPLVLDENQERVQADPITGLFSLGRMAPNETRELRVMLPCTVVAGCDETTFIITPLVDNGQTLLADQVVEVTTHYFPPSGTAAP